MKEALIKMIADGVTMPEAVLISGVAIAFAVVLHGLFCS